MQLSVSSGRFIQELQERIDSIGGNISVSLVVPEEMQWWYYQEFGTPSAYDIDPVSAKELVFPDPANPEGPRVHALHVHHPPIRARHMVSSVLTDIEEAIHSDFAEAATESGFDGEVIRQQIVYTTMERVKSLIAESFSERLPGTRGDGRLLGQTAAEVFETDAEIVER